MTSDFDFEEAELIRCRFLPIRGQDERGGVKNVCFCPQSGGVKKWQNSVHVVAEWPLISYGDSILLKQCWLNFVGAKKIKV